MKTKALLGLITLGVVASAVQPALEARADSPETAKAASLRLATGQYITPTALRGSVQQFLNPGLSAYPDFVAGEAVRSQLSPDGTTLAVLCAGQNSLDKADGSTDVANSTQYIFLYDVSGTHKQAPVLTQVIQQTNSHVGLVFSPDGGKLYTAGGKDDAVYVYTKTGSSWSRTATITLGHSKGVGIGVGPNASGLGISNDGATLVVANNYNDSISVIDTASGAVRYEHDLRPFFVMPDDTPVTSATGIVMYAPEARDDRCHLWHADACGPAEDSQRRDDGLGISRRRPRQRRCVRLRGTGAFSIVQRLLIRAQTLLGIGSRPGVGEP